MFWDDPSTEIAALHTPLTTIRRDIHQHPELGFEEVRTQKLVRQWLEARGYQPRDCAETGLVADLHPTAKAGPTIAFRADLDCLPMPEYTDLPYRSVHDGKAHKCGHDGHTTILMGLADLLATHRDDIPGNVRLLFQPAEEGVRGGGAKVMVAEGALEGVDECYGLHNWPGYPRGEVRVRAGSMLAQVHNFAITLTGVGGHASQPQLCIDPVIAGAHLVTALQTAVSRGLGADGGAVLSVSCFHAGDAPNIIPEKAQLEGTIRSYFPAATERVLARFHEIVRGTAAAFGVKIEIDVETGYPVLMNNSECAAAVARVAAGLGSPVSEAELPMAGGEDFAYFAQTVPSAYFFLGAQKPGENTPVCHHPDFDFDDELIPLGISMFVGILRDRLSRLPTQT